MRTHTFPNGVTVTDSGLVYGVRGKLLKQTLTPRGYLTVAWHGKNCKRHSIPVHQLVAMAFVDDNLSLFWNQVDHRNGRRTDNRAENLRYVNNSENNKAKFALRVAQGKPKLTEAERAARRKHGVRVAFCGDVWETITDMANFYHITPTAIRKALQRGSWCGKPITRVA